MMRVTLAAFCLSATAFSASAKASEQPNIVFILADDVGREVLGCYGGESYATPHLDELARSGLKFQHCYSMPVCHPTRVCLLTGKYPFQLGSPRWGTFPREYEKRTVAHHLRNAGYATAIAGKWQIAMLGEDLNHPHRLGFDEYCLFGWHEGPRYFDPLIWENGKQRKGTKGTYGPDVYTDYLLDFMRRNKARPFFAFYSMALCHDVTDDLDKPVPLGPKGRYESYGEMAESMDVQIGKLVKGIDDLGLRERTLILYTTDNGTPKSYIATANGKQLIRKPVTSVHNGKQIPGGKGDLTDLGTRVPTIASWPGIIPAGSETQALVDFVDVLPTFAEIAGVELDASSSSGSSIYRVLRNPTQPGKAWAFCERGKRYWVRTAEWKWYDNGRFFNMKDDPGESKPLAVTELDDAGQQAYQALKAAAEQLKP